MTFGLATRHNPVKLSEIRQWHWQDPKIAMAASAPPAPSKNQAMAAAVRIPMMSAHVL
jgi:hypothetical protein